jgi:hypothetical protein
VGAVDQHRRRALDEGRIDVADVQRHVGAVLAVEDQREGVRIADAQKDQGGQAVGIRDHPVGDDALAFKLFADEPAEMVGADPGQQAGVQAQPRGAHGRVGRAAADVFGERGHVLEPPTDLLAVQVDARTADGDQIESMF